MQKAFRIVKAKYAASALDGEGARIAGGRWNLKGTKMVYTSATASLAALESFVHLGVNQKSIDHVIVELAFPEVIVKIADPDELPGERQANPAPEACQVFGSDWVRSMRSAVLAVPSTIVHIEQNYLINPLHGDFDKIVMTEQYPFGFDQRMWK